MRQAGGKLRRRVMVRKVMACFALGAALAAPAMAGGKPLWEAGLGVGAISFPDYPGSSGRSHYLLPLPYFVYRGPILRADRSGLKARLIDRPRLALQLSLDASPPVRSSDDRERSGMPDIRPMLAFGPSMAVHLWRSAARRMRLDLRLPLRSVFSVRNPPRQIGWQFAPVLNLDVSGLVVLPRWNLGLQAGPVFADRRYAATFYSVAQSYARPGRPAYRARGGFAGSQFTLALSRRFARYWIGCFARLDDLHGAVFADSPLVSRRTNLSLGIGIAWILGQSARTVSSDD